MSAIVVIPARMASTRLPGKPLADIAGVPMIVRVWRQAVAANVGPVIVAAAERHGIATPLNGALLTLLRAVNDAALNGPT